MHCREKRLTSCLQTDCMNGGPVWSCSSFPCSLLLGDTYTLYSSHSDLWMVLYKLYICNIVDNGIIINYNTYYGIIVSWTLLHLPDLWTFACAAPSAWKSSFFSPRHLLCFFGSWLGCCVSSWTSPPWIRPLGPGSPTTALTSLYCRSHLSYSLRLRAPWENGFFITF